MALPLKTMSYITNAKIVPACGSTTFVVSREPNMKRGTKLNASDEESSYDNLESIALWRPIVHPILVPAVILWGATTLILTLWADTDVEPVESDRKPRQKRGLESASAPRRLPDAR